MSWPAARRWTSASSRYWAFQHECVEREAERAELVLLAVSIRLPQLASVAVEDGPRDGVPAFVAGQADP